MSNTVMRWRDVGHEAFDLHFLIYDQQIDHEAAQETVVKLIEEAIIQQRRSAITSSVGIKSNKCIVAPTEISQI